MTMRSSVPSRVGVIGGAGAAPDSVGGGTKVGVVATGEIALRHPCVGIDSEEGGNRESCPIL